MTRTRREGRPKQEPPVQFRPGAELRQLVAGLADNYGLALNETFRDLAALAVVGLDARYFRLLHQMAVTMGGVSPFVRTCLHVHAALQGAERVRGGQTLPEPERSRFVLQTVTDFVTSKGSQVDTQGLWFLPPTPPEQERVSQPESGPRVRRRVRRFRGSMGLEAEREAEGSEAWQSQRPEQAPQQRVRVRGS